MYILWLIMHVIGLVVTKPCGFFNAFVATYCLQKPHRVKVFILFSDYQMVSYINKHNV